MGNRFDYSIAQLRFAERAPAMRLTSYVFNEISAVASMILINAYDAQ